LKGIAVGNGWIDPNLQTYAYIPFAHGAGFIEQQQVDYLTDLFYSCQSGYLSQKYTTPECANIFGWVSGNTGYQGLAINTSIVNVYDIRIWDVDGGAVSWPVGENVTAVYLNRTDVRTAINANAGYYYKSQLTECDGTVGEMLAGDGKHSSLSYFFFVCARSPHHYFC
jgi:carboxypeptidase C (cathepsin A)